MKKVISLVLVLLMVMVSTAGAHGAHGAHELHNNGAHHANCTHGEGPKLSEKTLEELRQYSGTWFRVGDLSPAARAQVKTALFKATGVHTDDDEYISLQSEPMSCSYSHLSPAAKNELNAKGPKTRVDQLSAETRGEVASLLNTELGDDIVLDIDSDSMIIMCNPLTEWIIKKLVEWAEAEAIGYVVQKICSVCLYLAQEDHYVKSVPACGSPYWCNDMGMGTTVMWIGHQSVTFACNNCGYQWTEYI